MKESKADDIARNLVEKIFTFTSIPELIINDNAHNFESELLKRLYKLLKTRNCTTSFYHAQSNKVERYHKDLGNYLRNFIENDQKSWSDLIPYAVFSYNTSVNESTKFSPFEIIFGKKPNIDVSPNKIYTYDDYVSQLKFVLERTKAIAKDNEKSMKDKNKKYYDKNVRIGVLQKGDLVFMKNVPSGDGRKLQNKFRGPYPVLEVKNAQNVKILYKNKELTVHRNNVSKYQNAQ